MASITVGNKRPARRASKPALIAGVCAALALMAGVGAWQLSQRADSTDTERVTSATSLPDTTDQHAATIGGVAEQMREQQAAASATLPQAGETTATIGGVAEQMREQAPQAPARAGGTAAGRDTRLAVYLVASEAQAAQLRQTIADLGQNVGLQDSLVLVAATPEEEAQIAQMWQAIGSEQGFGGGVGLPGVVIHDLRLPALDTGSGPDGMLPESAPPTDIR